MKRNDNKNDSRIESIRVLIVDDHPLVRMGIRSLLETAEDVEVVGEASSGREALEKAQVLLPDVVLLDLLLRDMNGVEVLRELKKRLPHVRVLVLSMVAERQAFLRTLEEGASGYVLKEADPDELLRALRSITRGGVFLSPQAAQALVQAHLTQAKEDSGLYTLTRRERQVLTLVAQGHTNREIAQMLSLSTKTVEKHRARAMGKMGLRTRADLVRFALERGLLSP